MEKSLAVNFKQIQIVLEIGLIKVSSNLALWEYLRGKDKVKIHLLASEIKNRYFEKYGRELHISQSSLVVEILIHVYCHNLGLTILPFIKNTFLEKFLKKLIERAEVIDCGEKKRDSNRWVWDLLSHFERVVLMVFPKKLK